MGLESAVSHPLVVEPKHLIAAADSNIVTPTAVDALTDAFRKGAITPLDIQNRQQQNQKNELDIQNAQREAAFNSDPQIVEARRSAAIAHGSVAKAAQAQAESELKLQPLSEEVARGTKAKAIFENQSLTPAEQVGTAFQLLGLPVPRKSDGAIDTEAAAPVTQAYREYAGEGTRLTVLVTPHGKQEFKSKDANGNIVTTTAETNALGNVITDADRKAAADYQQGRFTGWMAKRTVQPKEQPAVAPGVTFQDTAPVNKPVVGPQQDFSSLIQPKASTAVPATTPILGQSFAGQPGQVTAIEAAPEKPSKPLTEAQANSVMYAARMQQANSTIQSSTLDPTAKVAAGMAAVTPHAFQSNERQAYEGAKDAFLLGVLRRESGAAISTQERDEYGKFYFPRAGETPSTVQDKAERRQLAVEMMRTTADPNFIVPTTKEAFDTLVKNLALTKGTAAPAAAQGTPAKTLSTGRKIGVTPSGQFYTLP